ncbi:MAG: hypothetical protein OEX81_00045 [Candidatus Pacebacteria bacterium]|nr:hypothetical protein [Candidatus Paceibacterota bacterium]
MSDKYKPPYQTKFKPGDSVKYDNKLWKIDGWCLLSGSEHAYDISTPSGKGLYIKGVKISEGDKYFSKA